MSQLPDAPLFLSAELVAGAEVLTIQGDEASHAVRSRRLGEGDLLNVTNGRGLVGQGRISHIERKPDRIRLDLVSVTESAEPRMALELASAIPKGDRVNTLLDMSTQLGMTAFQPLECARSVVRIQPRALERWQRIIVSAAKQCRQSRFPELRQMTTLDALVASIADTDWLLYGEATGKSIYQSAQGIIPPPTRLVLIVGPEGGFDDRELVLLRQCPRATGIACGPMILRTETAGPALLSAANQWLADISPT